MRTKRYFFGLPAVLLAVSVSLTMGLVLTGCGGDDGDGPIKIRTAAQFNAIRNNLDGHYVLEADIDLSGYDNWEPIGIFEALSEEEPESPNPAKVFSGTFDGNGHTISNVTINHPDIPVGVGLFGFAVGGSIRNLTIQNVNVIGFFLVGGLVGGQACTVENITLVGNNTITGVNGTGGIVGVSMAGLKNCTATANIVVSNMEIPSVDNGYAGIVAGGREGPTPLINCIASGSITASGDSCILGGVCGAALGKDEVRGCEAVNVTINAPKGKGNIGGLLGFVGPIEGEEDADAPALVIDCKVENITIMVASDTVNVGGLAGGSLNGSIAPAEHTGDKTLFAIKNCQASGTITNGTTSVGSIAGHAYKSTVENSTSTVTWSGGTLNQIGSSDNG
ncbi:MAG: hypothetical protein LBL31_07385 [Spirochaetaceae bacterium]|jgi:hypothetical protein|nr:hypothetical protein [Spirochaetaceae bacterium]